MAQTAVAIGFSAVTLWVVATTLWIDWIVSPALPWGDHWDHWRTVLADGYSAAMLVAQHNEHRILTARVLFWLDEHFFGAANVLIFGVILLVQLSHALLLWREGASLTRRTPAETAGVAALPLCAMFSSHQYTNFTWAFQVAFVMVYLAATIAFVALARSAPASGARRAPNSRAWFAAALVAAWTATGSLANGLMTWPLLLGAGIWLDAGRWRIAAIAANGLTAWTLYFWTYTSPPHHGSMLDGLRVFPAALAFGLTFLGAPLEQPLALVGGVFADTQARVIASIAAGVVGAAGWVRLSLRARRHGRAWPRAQIVLWLIATFILATAAVTALGRASLFPVAEAMTSRYLTPALVFWSALLLMAWPSAAASGRTRAGLAYAAGVLALVTSTIAVIQVPRIAYARAAMNHLAEVEAAVAADVYQPEVWNRIYYASERLPPVVDYLREHRLSLFRAEWTQWPGRPVRTLFTIRPSGECVGSFDEVSLVGDEARPGFRVSGWAWDLQRHEGPTRVVFVDQRGLILASTAAVHPRLDVPQARPDQVSTPDVGWRGFVSYRGPARIEAYLVREHEATACHVGGAETPASVDAAGSVAPRTPGP